MLGSHSHVTGDRTGKALRCAMPTAAVVVRREWREVVGKAAGAHLSDIITLMLAG